MSTLRPWLMYVTVMSLLHTCHKQKHQLQWWMVVCNMMTSSTGNIFSVSGPLWIRRSLVNSLTKASAQSFDVSYDLRLNKRLSKLSSGWWFEMPLCSSLRHCNEVYHIYFGVVLQDLQLVNVCKCITPFYTNSHNLPRTHYWWPPSNVHQILGSFHISGPFY